MSLAPHFDLSMIDDRSTVRKVCDEQDEYPMLTFIIIVL